MTHPHFVLPLEASPSISLLHLTKQQAGWSEHEQKPTEIQGSQQTSQSNAPLWQMALFICSGP